jgi:toxin YoeB
VRLTFTPHAWKEYQQWLVEDRAVLKRINRIIEDTLREPFDGIGKPEPLKHMLQGVWSRRITEEHRMVYLVQDDDLVIVQLRYHY